MSNTEIKRELSGGGFLRLGGDKKTLCYCEKKFKETSFPYW